MRIRVYRALALTITVLIDHGNVNGEVPLGTSFTYQGQLKAGGVPADGNYDFVFRLYDAETDGTQVGGAVTIDNWPVESGLFTLRLDFGAGAIASDARWIAIDVRQHGSGTDYTTLSPRQPLTAAPVAAYALDGPGSTGFWVGADNNIHNANTGYVGIGTDTPLSDLHVGGTGAVRLEANGSAGSFTLFEDSHPTQLRLLKYSQTGAAMIDMNPSPLDGTGYSSIRFFRETNTTGPKIVNFYRGNNTTAVSAGIGVDGGDSYFQLHGGGVGIGTANPAARFDVTDDVLGRSSVELGFATRTGEALYTPGQQIESMGFSYKGVTPPVKVSEISLVNYNHSGSGWYDYVERYDAGLAFSTASDGVLHQRMTVTSVGEVGIGTASPKGRLHVNGDYYGRGHLYLYAYQGDGSSGTAYVQARDDSGASSIDLQLRTQNTGAVTEAMKLTAAGNVGIGTTSPEARLHVTTSDTYLAKFNQFGTGAGVSISLINGASNHSALSVYSASGNAPALSVSGMASVDVLQIYGADVAEKFPVSEETEPGTVVEIHPDRPGKLRIARGAYNRRVAGVVSGAGDIPSGTILANMLEDDDAKPIALSGRVWVKCDATATAIELGDLLTTSNMPGHAMAVRDFNRAPGTVIGKAMTSLARGETGLVLVLVNLQ